MKNKKDDILNFDPAQYSREFSEKCEKEYCKRVFKQEGWPIGDDGEKKANIRVRQLFRDKIREAYDNVTHALLVLEYCYEMDKDEEKAKVVRSELVKFAEYYFSVDWEEL